GPRTGRRCLETGMAVARRLRAAIRRTPRADLALAWLSMRLCCPAAAGTLRSGPRWRPARELARTASAGPGPRRYARHGHVADAADPRRSHVRDPPGRRMAGAGRDRALGCTADVDRHDQQCASARVDCSAVGGRDRFPGAAAHLETAGNAPDAP